MDSRIVPGAWIETCFGKAVCIDVNEHAHSLALQTPQPGIVMIPCADDSCKDAKYVLYRYRARRCKYDSEGQIVGYEDKVIWVINGDLSTSVKYLRPPTQFTARILKLEGPYGEGRLPCGPYVEGYCHCGLPIHD